MNLSGELVLGLCFNRGSNTFLLFHMGEALVSCFVQDLYGEFWKLDFKGFWDERWGVFAAWKLAVRWLREFGVFPRNDEGGVSSSSSGRRSSSTSVATSKIEELRPSSSKCLAINF